MSGLNTSGVMDNCKKLSTENRSLPLWIVSATWKTILLLWKTNLETNVRKLCNSFESYHIGVIGAEFGPQSDVLWKYTDTNYELQA